MDEATVRRMVGDAGLDSTTRGQIHASPVKPNSTGLFSRAASAADGTVRLPGSGWRSAPSSTAARPAPDPGRRRTTGSSPRSSPPYPSPISVQPPLLAQRQDTETPILLPILRSLAPAPPLGSAKEATQLSVSLYCSGLIFGLLLPVRK